MRRATTAPKADRTESEGAVLRHHAQGAGLRSLPRPRAGTASQAPRSSLPRPRAGTASQAPRSSLPCPPAGTASQAPRSSLPCPPAGTASQAPRSSLAFLPRLSSRVSAGEAQAPGMKSRRNEPLTFNTFLMIQPGDLGL